MSWASEQGRSGASTEGVTHLVARDRSHGHKRTHEPEWVVQVCTTGDQESGGEQQRVSGQEETDQQPALSEHDDQNSDQAEGRDSEFRKFGPPAMYTKFLP